MERPRLWVRGGASWGAFRTTADAACGSREPGLGPQPPRPSADSAHARRRPRRETLKAGPAQSRTSTVRSGDEQGLENSISRAKFLSLRTHVLFSF